MIAQGRRIGGLPGAMVAGAMIAIRDIYEGPKRDEAPVVVDAPSEPHDIDRDGVRPADEVGADGISVPASRASNRSSAAAAAAAEPSVGCRRACCLPARHHVLGRRILDWSVQERQQHGGGE